MSAATARLGRPLSALAMLLDYPDAELQAHGDEIAGAVTERSELPTIDRRALAAFIAQLADSDLLELQARYTDTFDRGRKVSLHLFEHVHGDSRDRGQAMVELQSIYAENGLEIASVELPDYLPIFLEFSAQLSDDGALAWLNEVGPILQHLHVRLDARQSPYAVAVRALLRLADLDPWPAELTRAAAGERRDDTPSALDADWREAPVDFGPDPSVSSCASGRTGSGATSR